MADEIRAMLTLEVRKDGRARLTATSPKAPAVGATAVLGVERDSAGNYHFLLGSGEKVYTPEQLPTELKKLVGGGGSSGPPTPMAVPGPAQLLRTDGTFMTFEQYDLNRRLFHSPVGPTLGPVWPALPPAVYQHLINSYTGAGNRPAPPAAPNPFGPGDYPLPAGDSATV